jgi:hypothetical protein
MSSLFVCSILIAWLPIAVILFHFLPAPRALIVGVLASTMFLPMGLLELHFIPGDKSVFTSVGLLLGALLMAPGPLQAFRPKWIDLPMIVFTIIPAISAIANGKQPYTAAADTAATFCVWGLPYLLGRVYLSDLRALRELAIGLFIAGLVYAPGCIYEMFASAKLHSMLYGFFPHSDWSQTVRWGGYRPTMFMQHGLMVSTFMCAGATMGIWLLWIGAIRRAFYHVPTWVFVMFLTLVGVACKSTGAVVLMLIALAALLCTRHLRRAWLVYALAAAPMAYILARSVGEWDGENLVQWVGTYINVDNAGSLQVRFENEALLVDRALIQPWFGWGRGGDFLVRDNVGNMISIPDGWWVIALGTTGVVGLVASYAALLLPALALLRRFPAATWRHPAMAAPGALAIFLLTYALDCLMNAMINPAYLVALGGVATAAVCKHPLPRTATVAKQSMPNRVIPAFLTTQS